MKKLSKNLLFCIVALLFVSTLTACNKKVEEASFESNQNGITTTVTYQYLDDIVKKQSTKTVIPYSVAKVKDAEEAKKVLSKTANEFKGIKGLEYNLNFEADKVIEDITVDYSKADIKEITKLSNFSSSDSVNSDVQFISFSKSEKFLESKGFKKVK